jgi:hypothetical protein
VARNGGAVAILVFLVVGGGDFGGVAVLCWLSRWRRRGDTYGVWRFVEKCFAEAADGAGELFDDSS